MSSHPTSIWRRSPNKLRQSELWQSCFHITSLFLGALILFLVNLGELPLLDWNEGIVAQIAKEIYQEPNFLATWVFPTLGGEPYLAQPALVHGLIAIAYKIGGVNEFTTRLPGAFLGAVSVILLYNIGREIFVARFPALCSALIYLTCLPVVRFSRLAMLDGPLLCFELLTIWAILRSRRDLRWSFVIGMGFGLMSLTKGIVTLQILVVVGVFLIWDTPRMFTSSYFVRGILLGVAPGIAWYITQWFHYDGFKSTGDFLDLLQAQITPIRSEIKFSPKYYLIQSLQYIFPWMIVMLAGLKFASRNVHWGWGKLILAWTGVYLALALLILNQEYWSIIPIYPGLALAGGKQLDFVRNLPSYIEYPQVWTYGFALMAVGAAFAGLHWGIRDYVDFYLPFICGSLAITFGVTAIVIAQQDKQFIPLLFWGLFVTMFLLIISPHWIWELKTILPVKPIAELVQQHTPEKQVIYTSITEKRPSLEFYSDRQIVFQEIADLQYHWLNDPNVYLLLDSATIKKLNLPSEVIVSNSQIEPLKLALAIKES